MAAVQAAATEVSSCSMLLLLGTAMRRCGAREAMPLDLLLLPGGSSQVSGVTGGKGGEKEKEVSEPANSPGSAQRELRWMTAECLELQRRKGGERETPEPPRSASSSEGRSCAWFPLPLDRFPLSPVAISSCRGAARAGREGTIGEVKVSCWQRGL
ncbi:uncharacterized protein O9250_010851 [Rhynochetos jubatus]